MRRKSLYRDQQNNTKPCWLFSRHGSLYFLLCFIEKIAVKELPHGNLQSVANLLDGYHAGILALLVEHTVDGGRRNAGNIRQRVYSEVVLLAKLYDPVIKEFTINRVGYIANLKTVL